MTNAAEQPSIKYISGVNDALRDVKSAIFNKDAPHQKYTIQSNSLSWAKRNKSLCVSLNPPLKESRLIRKNGRASYFIDVFVLLYFVNSCLDLYSMFVFDSVKRTTIKLDKTQKGELWTLVIKNRRVIVNCVWSSDLSLESSDDLSLRGGEVGTKYQWETHARHHADSWASHWLV